MTKNKKIKSFLCQNALASRLLKLTDNLFLTVNRQEFVMHQRFLLTKYYWEHTRIAIIPLISKKIYFLPTITLEFINIVIIGYN